MNDCWHFITIDRVIKKSGLTIPTRLILLVHMDTRVVAYANGLRGIRDSQWLLYGIDDPIGQLELCD